MAFSHECVGCVVLYMLLLLQMWLTANFEQHLYPLFVPVKPIFSPESLNPPATWFSPFSKRKWQYRKWKFHPWISDFDSIFNLIPSDLSRNYTTPSLPNLHIWSPELIAFKSKLLLHTKGFTITGAGFSNATTCGLFGFVRNNSIRQGDCGVCLNTNVLFPVQIELTCQKCKNKWQTMCFEVPCAAFTWSVFMLFCLLWVNI